MLVNAGYDTVAITRKMSQPYEDNPAWHKVKRELLDRESDPDFIQKLKAMEPDIIVDLVNFNIRETKKIVEGFQGSRLSHYVYCSSCWAHGMAQTIPFDPDDLRKERSKAPAFRLFPVLQFPSRFPRAGGGLPGGLPAARAGHRWTGSPG